MLLERLKEQLMRWSGVMTTRKGTRKEIEEGRKLMMYETVGPFKFLGVLFDPWLTLGDQKIEK